MKNRFSVSILLVVCAALLFLTFGCAKEQTGKKPSSKSTKKNETVVSVPHGVAFFGSYWDIPEDGAATYFSDVIPGTMVEVATKGGNPETKKVQTGDSMKDYVSVKVDDEYLWIDSDNIVLDVLPYYVLETGTDVFLYEKPDADSSHDKRLLPDTIVAFVEQCENTREYQEGQKFARIKVPTSNPGIYDDGYIRLSNIDNSPAHLAMIQVARKYSQMVGSGNVPVEILNELEDTVEELRSWGGR